MEPLIVLATGNNITFTGQGFFNSTMLNCKFGNELAAAVYYINTTKIICTTPVVTNSSLDYYIYVTLNGYEYVKYFNS